jgi:hypothetical protein
MTKEEQLRAEVDTLRAAHRIAQNTIQNLEAELGRTRADLDNVQDKRGATTILDILTEEGFERLSASFPKGLRENGNPIRPTDTAISVVNLLVRRVSQMEQASQNEREMTAEIEQAYNSIIGRNVDLSVVSARMTRALAEFAMREAERPLDGAPTPTEDEAW